MYTIAILLIVIGGLGLVLGLLPLIRGYRHSIAVAFFALAIVGALAAFGEAASYLALDAAVQSGAWHRDLFGIAIGLTPIILLAFIWTLARFARPRARRFTTRKSRTMASGVAFVAIGVIVVALLGSMSATRYLDARLFYAYFLVALLIGLYFLLELAVKYEWLRGELTLVFWAMLVLLFTGPLYAALLPEFGDRPWVVFPFAYIAATALLCLTVFHISPGWTATPLPKRKPRGQGEDEGGRGTRFDGGVDLEGPILVDEPRAKYCYTLFFALVGEAGSGTVLVRGNRGRRWFRTHYPTIPPRVEFLNVVPRASGADIPVTKLATLYCEIKNRVEEHPRAPVLLDAADYYCANHPTSRVQQSFRDIARLARSARTPAIVPSERLYPAEERILESVGFEHMCAPKLEEAVVSRVEEVLGPAGTDLLERALASLDLTLNELRPEDLDALAQRLAHHVELFSIAVDSEEMKNEWTNKARNLQKELLALDPMSAVDD